MKRAIFLVNVAVSVKSFDLIFRLLNALEKMKILGLKRLQ